MDCINCVLQGDLAKCKQEICGVHNTWFARKQQEIIDNLNKQLDGLRGMGVCDCQGCRLLDDIEEST